MRSSDGTIACRHYSGQGVAFGDERLFPWDRLALPLTVLYRPDQPTPTVKLSAKAVAESLADSLNLVGPLRYIFRAPVYDQLIEALDVLLAQEIENASSAVLALLPGRHHQAAAALSVALDAILEPIEALHYPANRDFDRTPICADCHGKAGTHPCGCWAEYDQYPICGECGAQDHMPLESDDYPCPTRRACDQIRAELGGGEQ